jgi:hypothetical protein
MKSQRIQDVTPKAIEALTNDWKTTTQIGSEIGVGRVLVNFILQGVHARGNCEMSNLEVDGKLFRTFRQAQ